MRRIAFAVVALMLPFSFAACDAETDTAEYNYEPSDPGGFGMTYNGKLGYDYGGGFTQPFDGSAPSFGYSF